MKKLLFIFCLVCPFLLCNCQPELTSPTPLVYDNSINELPIEVRTALAPNSLFEAIYKNDLVLFEQSLKVDSTLTNTKNEEFQETPLATAIRLRKTVFVNRLIPLLNGDHFFETNIEGEGYIFLLAKYGFAQQIKDLTQLYRNEITFFDDYEFSDLDFENNNGQRALHVSFNGAVAEALKVEWFKGSLEFTLTEFARHTDINGNNFLHSAALDGRIDMIKWANQSYCPTEDHSDDDWIDTAVDVLATGVEYAKFYILPDGDKNSWIEVHTSHLFNWKNLDGNTALHLAARELRLNSLQNLANCQWIDFAAKNKKEYTPIHYLVQQLNVKVDKTSHAAKQAFEFLFYKKSFLRDFQSFSDLLAIPNFKGDSILHTAARLNDEYFYNRLAQYVNPQQPNFLGQTPTHLKSAKESLK